MRRRVALAAAIELALIGLVAAMFVFSIYFVQQERAWREQGMGVGPTAQIAVDISMWWLAYWWLVAPLLVLGGLGLAAILVFTGRRTPPEPAAVALSRRG